jgi:hypothetical protein
MSPTEASPIRTALRREQCSGDQPAPDDIEMKRRFVLLEQNSDNPSVETEFDADEWITVFDRSILVTVDIQVREFSPYRHYLQLGGKLFRAIAITSR